VTSKHAHAVTVEGDSRRVVFALGLIVTFLVLEVVAAVVGRSLALFADAGHMLTDVGALAMSAWAIRLAQRPAYGRWTYGLRRAEILSAAVNGVVLVAMGLLIGFESVQRLIRPQHVTGQLVLAVALVGCLINLVAAGVLARTDRSSLNLRGVFVHVMTDIYAFVGTAAAGLIIILTSWQRADSIASLAVVALMAWAAWGLLRDAGRILLQATPEELDLDDVRSRLLTLSHVIEIHDLHAWTVSSGSTTLSAHVVVEDRCFDSGHAPQILDALQECLIDNFSIEHATLQLEPATHATHEDGLHP
jgi:cobalt-zinc-cadmium efflux system protein